MFDADEIAAIVERVMGDRIRQDIYARIGNPTLNPPHNIKVPLEQSDHPGMIWVHGISGGILEISGAASEGDQQAVSRALLKPNTIPDGLLVYGTPVRLRRRSGLYEVVDLDGLAAVEYLYGLRDLPQRVIDLSKLGPGLISPTAPPSNSVIVTGFPAVLQTTGYLIPNLQSSDLITAYAPGGSGLAAAVMIEVDPATNTLVYTAGSSFTDTRTHQEAFLANYPKTVNSARFLAGWIKVYNGMTVIQIADILHGQEYFSKSGGLTMAEIADLVLVDSCGDVLTSDGELLWSS